MEKLYTTEDTSKLPSLMFLAQYQKKKFQSNIEARVSVEEVTKLVGFKTHSKSLTVIVCRIVSHKQFQTQDIRKLENLWKISKLGGGRAYCPLVLLSE